LQHRENPEPFNSRSALFLRGKCSGPPICQNVLFPAEAAEIRLLPEKTHFDLALQVQADIQMLYHYITSPPKKQGVPCNFFTLRKNPVKPAAVFANAPENKHSGSAKTKPLSHVVRFGA
jgi:hypothetical protein